MITDLANLFLEISIALGIPQLVPNARLESEAAQLVEHLLAVRFALPLTRNHASIDGVFLWSSLQRLPEPSAEERDAIFSLTDASDSSALLVVELATVATALSRHSSVSFRPWSFSLTHQRRAETDALRFVFRRSPPILSSGSHAKLRSSLSPTWSRCTNSLPGLVRPRKVRSLSSISVRSLIEFNVPTFSARRRETCRRFCDFPLVGRASRLSARQGELSFVCSAHRFDSPTHSGAGFSRAVQRSNLACGSCEASAAAEGD